MRLRRLILAIVLAFAAPALSQPLPTVAPEDAGLSRERLQRLDAAAARLVDERSIAGAVVLVGRSGGIAHFAAYGHMDVEAKTPMRRDAIFRICSMSKPITSVAALILFEEGHFLLDDPIAKFLPEFEKPQVLAEAPTNGNAPTLVPATTPITVRHLLTHTSGITYRFLGQPVISDLYSKAGINDGLSECEFDLAENVRRIAAQPLIHQPGEKLSYGLNTDVLGRLIEVVAKKPLGEFLEERLFGPLGMTDTGFTVPSEKLERLPKIYRTDRGQGVLEALADGPTTIGPLVFSPSYPYRAPHRLQSGGGGLVSSAMDYARFAAMIASGGELEGTRILSRKTIELMTANHLASMEPKAPMAFGLGLSIAGDPGKSGEIMSEGTHGWDGFYSTRFWIDLEEEMIGLVLTQTYPYNSGRALDRLQTLAYQAIVD